MSSTPPQNPPPLHYPGHNGRVGHRLRPVAIAAIIAVVLLVAAAVTAVFVLSGRPSPHRPPPMLPGNHGAAAARNTTGKPTARGVTIRLTAAGPVNVAQGISVTPAPGWTLAERGPNWVSLADADNTAKMRVTVKPASGTDVEAVLQADINNELARTIMTNVNVLGTPATRAVNGRNFQQAASTDYAAEISGQLGTTHVLGVFVELLNPSTRLSAFVEYRELADATTQPVGAGEMMINSML